MNALHGNCHLLSEESLKKLVNYYKTGILSTHDQNLLLNEITNATDISPDATFTRTTELNPVSRDHISWCLQEHYKWEPTQHTPTGKPMIDETVLKEVAASGITIAEDFLKCLTITKKLGMISEGMNAWLKLCTTASRIHHHCSVATNTHRCAHRKPNLSQVPSDHDCRKLFKATPGHIMVGADLAGIELTDARSLPCTL